MNVRLEQVTKSYGQQKVVQEINLEVQSGELMLLLGPSGCGKSTILRLLAGFIEPDSGKIFFDERLMNGIPAHKRPTAMVFQTYALWPHLSVLENIAYGLRVRRLSQAEITKRVDEALEQIQMTAFRDRKPNQLSGGQQQRVALARAFVVRPELLLFDEPLCNLDQRLRLEMRTEIKRLQTQTGITSLYVTHDQEEALALATQVAVMHQGQIQQLGTAPEVYHHPRTTFVARFVGEMNLYTAGNSLAQQHQLSHNQTLGFRPEAVRVSLEGTDLPAIVRQSTFLGSRYELLIETDCGVEIKVWSREGYPVGSRVFYEIPPGNLLTYTDEQLAAS